MVLPPLCAEYPPLVNARASSLLSAWDHERPRFVDRANATPALRRTPNGLPCQRLACESSYNFASRARSLVRPAFAISANRIRHRIARAGALGSATAADHVGGLDHAARRTGAVYG